MTLQWRHNGRDSVSNHQPHDCLLNRLFRRRSKKISKPRVTGLCVGNSPGTGEFPAQMASYAEHFSIWWRHHESKCTGNSFGFMPVPEDSVPPFAGWDIRIEDIISLMWERSLQIIICYSNKLINNIFKYQINCGVVICRQNKQCQRFHNVWQSPCRHVMILLI